MAIFTAAHAHARARARARARGKQGGAMTPEQIFDLRKNAKIPGRVSRQYPSQREFAATLHIPVRTLRAWEQGVRQPSGAAAVLLELLAAKPDILEALQKK